MADYIGIKEFSEITGYNPEYCRQLCRTGKGPRFGKFGRKIVFTRQAVDEWVQSRVVTTEGK